MWVAQLSQLPVACDLAAVFLSCSDKLLNDVYGYWAGKRKRWGKPILRRLQAPTIASDTNPYNTFRCANGCPNSRVGTAQHIYLPAGAPLSPYTQ